MSEGETPRGEGPRPGGAIVGDEATLHAPRTPSGDGSDPTLPAPTPPGTPRAVAGDAPTLYAAQTGDDAETLPRGSGPSAGAPARIGRYQVTSRLGEGGMGVVYAAHDPQLDRRVAVKLVRPVAGEASAGGEAQARLLREAQALARLRHPNIVQVYEAGAFGDQVFVAMEFVDGVTLRTWQFEHARGWREVLRVYKAAGLGLAAAHRAGIIHRDFKPDNVLVTPNGEPRVLDFGLASRQGHAAAPREPAAATSALDAHVTMTGALVGTPAYMSPEQLRGDPAGPRSDVFAFCVALYEALYGVRPFAGASLVEIAANVFTHSLTPPSTFVKVPTWLRRAVVRGLRVDPELRYRDMGELLAALDRDPARLAGWAAAVAAALIVVALFARALRSAEGEQIQVDLGARLRADFDARRIADLEARLAAAERASLAAARDRLLLAQADAARLGDPERALALLAHLSPASDAWLPTARLIAFGAALRLSPRRTLPGEGAPARAVAFSPRGDLLVSADAAGGLALIRVADGEVLARARLDAPARAISAGGPIEHDSSDLPQRPFPSGLRIAALTDAGDVALWEAPGGPLRPLPAAGRALVVALDEAGEIIALGGDDGRLHLHRWDGAPLRTHAHHRAPIRALAFAPAGDRLASAAQDGAVILWNLAKNTRRELTSLAAAPRGLAFAGDALLASTAAGSVRRWREGDGVAAWVDRLDGAQELAAAADGAALLARAADGAAWIDRGPARARRALARPDAAVVAVALAPAGDVAALALETGDVDLLRVAPLAERAASIGGARPQALAWSADGARLAAATNDGRVHLIDAATGGAQVLAGAEPPIRALAFGPGGDGLVAELGRGALAAWRLDAPDAPPTLLRTRADDRYLSRVVWSSPRELLRVASGPTLGLVALDLSAPPERASTYLGDVTGGAIDVSADGRWLIALGDGPPQLWERRGDAVQPVPLALPTAGWTALASAFVGDGARLAALRRDPAAPAGPAALAVWQVDLAAPAAHLVFEASGVREPRTDGLRRALAWRDGGGALHLWDLAGDPPRRLPADVGRVQGLALAGPARRALLWGLGAADATGTAALLVDLRSGAAIEVEPRAEHWAIAPTGAIAAAGAEIGVVILSDPVPADADALRAWLRGATDRRVKPEL